MSEFRLEIADWTGSGVGSPEEVATRGMLRLAVGSRVLTRHESAWSRSVTDRLHVSMYPLALWIAANWWRLGHEAPREHDLADYDWRAAHDMPAAGAGYLWPPVRFRPDGRSVMVDCNPAVAGSGEPLRYLERAMIPVAIADFEEACARFVETVLARLRDVGLAATSLESVWQDVCGERQDPASCRGRRLEAWLHCDPEEASPRAVEAMRLLADEVGIDAVLECAGALGPALLEAELQRLTKTADSGDCIKSPAGQLLASADAAGRLLQQLGGGVPPWQQGMQVSQMLRSELGLQDNPLESADLAGWLLLPPGALANASDRSAVALGLAMEKHGEVHWLFRSRRAVSRRFEVARMLGDLLAYWGRDSWHPITELRSARQQYQRAFAAELLCPVAALQQFLGGERSEDAIAEAAEHFQVSDRLVGHQLENEERRNS